MSTEWVIVLLDSYTQLPDQVIGGFDCRKDAVSCAWEHYDGFDWVVCPVKLPTTEEPQHG